MTRPFSQARSKMRRAGSAAAGKGRLALLVDHEFDGRQHAAAADIADERVIPQASKPCHQSRTGLHAVFQKAVLVEPQNLEADGGADGMGRIGVAVADGGRAGAVGNRLVDVVGHEDGTHRHVAGGEAFGRAS